MHAGGKVPFDTGNLVRSLIIELDRAAIDQFWVTCAFQSRTTSTISAGDGDLVPLYLGYQAVYARRLNYGFTGTDSLGRTYNQSGRATSSASRCRNGRRSWPRLIFRFSGGSKPAAGGLRVR